MTTHALHMTRTELREIAESGGVAVVPTGSLEQHGTHLPVGTDSLLAERVSHEATARAQEHGIPGVVFPAIWTGFSPHHVPLGGTVTLQKETLLAVLDDVGDSLIEMGFESILFVNGHGGNRPAVSLAVGDMGTRQADADVGEVNYIILGRDVAADVRRGEPGSAFHAGEIETSLMLHLFPDDVDMGEAVDDPAVPMTSFSSRDMFAGGQLGMRRTYDQLTSHGVRGEATLGSAENGAALFDGIADQLASLLGEFAALE